MMKVLALAPETLISLIRQKRGHSAGRPSAAQVLVPIVYTV
jgi:hypothetical protein